MGLVRRLCAMAAEMDKEEGVLLYKQSGQQDKSIDRELYLKQRDGFLKNFRLLRTKYKKVSPESDLEIDKINEFGYREITKNQKIDRVYSSDLFINYIPSLEEEDKAITTNYDNVKFLFYKYKCLSYITHTLNSVYGDKVKRPKVLKSILIAQLEGLISGFLDLYHPKSYLKINDEIVIGKSDHYLLLNRIDFWNDMLVENLETLYQASDRFKAYNNGYNKAKEFLTDEKSVALKAIEYTSCSTMYYILRNSTGLYGDLFYKITKEQIEQYEKTIEMHLEKYFDGANFIYEDTDSPIKRINIYPLSNVVSMIGEESILSRIRDGYKIRFEYGDSYLLIEPELNGIELQRHIKIIDHKLEYSDYYNIVFMIKSVDYEIKGKESVLQIPNVNMSLEYECNEDIKFLINRFLTMCDADGINLGSSDKFKSVQVEKDRLYFPIENNLTASNFKDLSRSLVHVLTY